MNHTLRLFISEFIATALLLMMIVGSGIMAQRLSGGNVALALLANAIATGAGLVVLIHIFGPVSGARMNPVVSTVLWWQGELHLAGAMRDCLAQIAGGVVGVVLAHAMFDIALFQVSSTVRTGSHLWIAEIIATFGLFLTIFGCNHRNAEAAPFVIGLYITSAYWFTASTSFANPAVTIARSLTDTFAGIAPSGIIAFILAQCTGACLAVLLRPVLWPISETGEKEG